MSKTILRIAICWGAIGGLGHCAHAQEVDRRVGSVDASVHLNVSEDAPQAALPSDDSKRASTSTSWAPAFPKHQAAGAQGSQDSVSSFSASARSGLKQPADSDLSRADSATTQIERNESSAISNSYALSGPRAGTANSLTYRSLPVPAVPEPAKPEWYNTLDHQPLGLLKADPFLGVDLFPRKSLSSDPSKSKIHKK